MDSLIIFFIFLINEYWNLIYMRKVLANNNLEISKINKINF